MKKPTIFLDFDGLKFDTLMLHVNYMNERYGISSVPEDYINNPHLDIILNKYIPGNTLTGADIYPELAEKLLGSIEHHETVLPIEGMTEVIPLLAEQFTLVTVTARPESSLDVIKHMHAKYIPGCISFIHCVWRHKGNGVYDGISKRDFIMNYDGEKVAFLDDSATEIKRMQDIIPSYLFDPLGLNDEDKSIMLRVGSWYEFATIYI